MFPDLARDDVFRLETPRLWLRWPRICDAAAIHRFCSQWEVARYTARIPHPYPPGSAERFIYRRARSQRLRTRLEPGHDADQRQERRHRLDQPRIPRQRTAWRSACARAEAWGKGLATEAAEAMIDAAFGLTPTVEILASVRVENEASKAVLEKCGFARLGAGLQGAPARGGMVECHSFRLGRADWAGGGARRREASPGLARAP